MTAYENLSIAVPWSLSHYIPLNGFHPLYRALIDRHLENITINAWDNIELSQIVRGDNKLREELLNTVSVQHEILQRKISSDITTKYLDWYFPPNIALTCLLSGDIEFHHTAPFPSLTRPFVFHCESFAPIFFPFSHQGRGAIRSPEALRSHYRRIFEDPLCLGIFSHIPETLRDISHFFDSSAIDAKLHQSRIGLSSHSLLKNMPEKRWPVNAPRFLFINSAHQNPENFFHRGGHIVLRFWQELMASGHQGKLYLRCTRPDDMLLREHGVDIAFLYSEEYRSVIWVQDYLSNKELNALMADVHFFLLPSASLHSASIMQAMALGAVPIVTDTVGTSLYVKNGHNGIVLEGVFLANWIKDKATGVMVDNYHRNQALDDSLVAQLTRQVTALIAAPQVYDLLRNNALSCACTQFSGDSFSDDFWTRVQLLFTEYIDTHHRSKSVTSTTISALDYCKIEESDWPRIFESVPQPITRISSGNGRVTELGGAFIQTIGNSSMELHDWSVLAEYFKNGVPMLSYVKNIKDLGGGYLSYSGDVLVESRFRIIKDWISRLLIPYPSLHRFAARILKVSRKIGKLFSKRIRPEQQLGIQLVLEDDSGLNVIRYYDKYYAIPRHEGEFLVEKANEDGYSTCFIGNSFKEVLRKIAENNILTHAENGIENQSNEAPELIEEGVHGFNIIRFSDFFYAIPQSDGAFEYDRVIDSGYSRIFIEQSAEDVKAAIMRSCL